MSGFAQWASRGHLKLSLYFLVLSLAVLSLVWWRLELLLPPEDPLRAQLRWLLALAVLLTGGLGWLGVLVQRLRSLPERRRELQDWAERIQQEARRYRELFESSSDLLFLVEHTPPRIVDANAQAREVLGGVLPLTDPVWSALLSESQPGPRELTLQDQTGRPRRVEVRISGSRYRLVSLRDRTREREMERELAIRERLSSIGLFTAGVAHEINNPLEGITNYLKLLENPALDSATRARHLGSVQHGLARIRDLVRELLRFARPERSDARVDLSAAVASALNLVALSERLQSVQVRCEGLQTAVWVTGDSGRLEQVFVNLLLNAGQALGGHGQVVVRADLEPHNHCVHVVIEDNGPGIAPEHLSRLFDPFFTTGDGSGLGLSISYGIVRAHGGSMRAENRSEGGARFVITLPLASDKQP